MYSILDKCLGELDEKIKGNVFDIHVECTLAGIVNQEIPEQPHLASSYFSTACTVLESLLKDISDNVEYNNNLIKFISRKDYVSNMKKEKSRNATKHNHVIEPDSKPNQFLSLLHANIRIGTKHEERFVNFEPLYSMYASFSLEKEKKGTGEDKSLISTMKATALLKLKLLNDALTVLDEKLGEYYLRNRQSIYRLGDTIDPSSKMIPVCMSVLQSRTKYILWLLKSEEEQKRINNSMDMKCLTEEKLIESLTPIMDYKLSELWRSISRLINRSNTIRYTKNISLFFDMLYTCCGKYISNTFNNTIELDDIEFYSINEASQLYHVNLHFLRQSERMLYGLQLMFKYAEYLYENTTMYRRKSLDKAILKDVLHWFCGKNLSNRSILEPIENKIAEEIYKHRLLIGEMEIFKETTSMINPSSAIGAFRRNIQDITIKLLSNEDVNCKSSKKYKESLPSRIIKDLYYNYFQDIDPNDSTMYHLQRAKDFIKGVKTSTGCTEKESCLITLIVLESNVDNEAYTKKGFKGDFVVLKENWVFPPNEIIGTTNPPLIVEVFNQFVIIYNGEMYLFEDFFTLLVAWADMLCSYDPSKLKNMVLMKLASFGREEISTLSVQTDEQMEDMVEKAMIMNDLDNFDWS